MRRPFTRISVYCSPSPRMLISLVVPEKPPGFSEPKVLNVWVRNRSATLISPDLPICPDCLRGS